MGEKSDESTSGLKSDAIRTEAESLLEAIKKSKVQAEEQLKSAEASRKKADEDSLVIAQVKATIEERLKALEGALKQGEEVSSSYVSQIKVRADEQLKAAEAIRKKADEETSSTTQFKVKLDEFLKATELARQKADSEALFAFNAKKSCEEHSTAIAQLKGAVEANVNSIATNKQKADDLAALITANKPLIENDIKKVSDNRKEIEQAASNIKDAAEKGSTRLQEIETSKASANSLLEEVETLRDSTADARKKVDIAQTQSEDLLKKITTAFETSKNSTGAIGTMLVDSEKEKERLTEVVDHLAKSSEITNGFENELKTLIDRANNLLPGFADVSLASAFDRRRRGFLVPKVAWISTFIICIACLIYVAYPSFKEATSISARPPSQAQTDRTWEEIESGLVMRLPIVLPLLWLAIYAGRNYMLSIRLEEDYAHKEAVSRSFAGYKREMEKIASGQPAGADNPVTILCVNVLKAIAEHPGRIYEGKHHDYNVFTETKEATEKIADFSKKQIAAK